MMFSGLMSRCIIRLEWMYCKDSRRLNIIFFMMVSFKIFFFQDQYWLLKWPFLAKKTNLLLKDGY